MAEFDIAVIMGSQSDAVFDEYVEMHPGAKRLRQFWNRECKCGDPVCFRTGIQEAFDIAEATPERALAFLDGLRGFEPMTREEFDAAVRGLGFRKITDQD